MLPLPSSLPWAAVVFAAAGMVSLAAGGQLVARIEQAAGCFKVSDATIGLVAAFCADAPEITSSVTAVSHHQASVGIGVVFGSNIFNLAALLGLAAITSGGLAVRRGAATLEGSAATTIGIVSVLAAVGVLPIVAALPISCLLLASYVGLTVLRPPTLRRLGLPPSWTTWLLRAVQEEEEDATEVLPRRERGRRALPHLALAAGALVVVVAASFVMERSGVSIGTAARLPMIVTGGVLLAAATSLPNAVAAVYLARRARGGAVLAAAMNSNAFNVIAGFLVPSLVVNVSVDAFGRLSAIWYLAMTMAALTIVIVTHGLRRMWGAGIVVVYLGFVALLVAH